MPSEAEKYDLEWYVEISDRKNLPTARCPFASVNKCLRYYASLSLLRNAGHTSIDPATDKKLSKKWKQHPLWPVIDEQATGVAGPTGHPNLFSQFCPEVSYQAFELFASDLTGFSDETDREMRHKQLNRKPVSAGDWRWSWSDVRPLHYSECPLYAPLTQEKGEQTTLVDRIMTWGKNIPIIAVVIVFTFVIAALAELTKNFSTLRDAIKGEHGVVIVTKIGSGDVSSLHPKMDDQVIVQFEPRDSKQRIQEIDLIWPDGIGPGTDNEVVVPPLKTDIGFEMREMNGLLQPMVPKTILQPPYHGFRTHGSIPVVLRVNFLNSSGDAKSEDFWYELDFVYNVTQDCDRGCVTDTWGVGLLDIRYKRPLRWGETAKSLIAGQMARRHFVFEPSS